MSKTRTQIQKESDEKRGLKLKAFKLHVDDIAYIEQCAKTLDMPQNQMIMQALKAFMQNA